MSVEIPKKEKRKKEKRTKEYLHEQQLSLDLFHILSGIKYNYQRITTSI